jgi:hypothetical protein
VPRLGLGQIEDALRDPPAFRRVMDAAEGASFGETYVSALRQTVFLYHRTNDRVEAREYLRRRLTNSSRLNNPSRIFDTRDQLEWYIGEHEARGWATFQSPVRIRVPLRRNPSDLTCSGELVRLDLVPAGGYAAWLFVNHVGDNWVDELRFPIIQSTVAQTTLSVPSSEVYVGIYDLPNRRVETYQYSPSQLVQARRRLRRLVSDLGY